MGLSSKISQALNPGIFFRYLALFLGHCLLLNRASLPWRGTKPIRHTETCPGFFNEATIYGTKCPSNYLSNLTRSRLIQLFGGNVNCMAELILKMRHCWCDE